MEIGHLKEDEIPKWFFEKVADEIYTYSVSLSIDGAPGGSGTLVSFGRQFGILTAEHVLRHLRNGRDPDFSIVCARHTHRLAVDKDHIRSVQLPRASDNAKGPDLALIVIDDTVCNSALRAKKSFYPIERFSPKMFVQLPQSSAMCFVFGAPAEWAAESGIRGTSEHVLATTQFVGRVQVTGAFNHEGHECLELAVRAGKDGFPSDYGGVSGGGVWCAPVTMNPDKGTSSMSYEHLELIGAAFYQVEDAAGCMVLRAQSFKSFPTLLATVAGAS